jgi:hypothetical protein
VAYRSRGAIIYAIEQTRMKVDVCVCPGQKRESRVEVKDELLQAKQDLSLGA